MFMGYRDKKGLSGAAPVAVRVIRVVHRQELAQGILRRLLRESTKMIDSNDGLSRSNKCVCVTRWSDEMMRENGGWL